MTDREVELREHIRGLLLQYALTHLATNYVLWTQETVAKLLSDALQLAPMTAATAVSLPVDPFDTLSECWRLSDLDIYEERWRVEDPEALAFLRRSFAPPPSGKGIAERLWHTNSDDHYDCFLQHRAMSPILSAQAVRETPRPGNPLYAANVPRECSSLLQGCSIERVKNSTPAEIPVNVDDALENKLVIDPGLHDSVLALIRKIPNMAGRTTNAPLPVPIDDFLRAESPPVDFPMPEVLPLFPRDKRPGRYVGQSSGDSSSFAASLDGIAHSRRPWLFPVDVKEEDDDDIANENLVLVDGWHAFKTPSSPLTPGTPSLADGSSDIDEMFLPSSSAYPGDELMPIEEYQIPRAETRGNGNGRPKPVVPSDGVSLSTYLTPIPRTAQLEPRIIRSSKSQPSSPRTSITMSMLGQPPSAVDEMTTVDLPHALRRRIDDNPSSDDTIVFATKAVERACNEALGSQDPISLVLEEKLDEKDSMLMDVPLMRPPNEHTTEVRLPARLTDILAPVKAPHIVVEHEGFGCTPLMPHLRFIKKVKGVQSLQIELSWIPFKYGPTVPTDEEVADVTNGPGPELSRAIDLAQEEITERLSTLLDDLDHSKASNSQSLAAYSVPSHSVWQDDTGIGSSEHSSSHQLEDASLILPRSDCRRLAGLAPLEYLDDDTGSSDKENEFDPLSADAISDGGSVCERPMKKVRFYDLETEIPGASPISYEYQDDSGVLFVDDMQDITLSEEELDEQSTSSFVQLAFDAEGFDGPIGDGDLFPDMHYDDYVFDIPPSTNPFAFSRIELGHPSPSPTETRNHAAPTDWALSQDTIADNTNMSPRNLSLVRRVSHENAAPIHLQRAQDYATQQLNAVPLLTRHSHPASNTARVDAQADEPWTRDSRNHSQECNPQADDDEPRVNTRRAVAAAPVFSARQSLAQYLTFCGKASLLSYYASDSQGQPGEHPDPLSVSMPGLGGASPASASLALAVTDSSSRAPRDTPTELLDAHTLVLPDDHPYMSQSAPSPRTPVHRYIASMDLIQRRALVRALASRSAIDCVERELLGENPPSRAHPQANADANEKAGDVHLILDCETAVLFFVLEALPARGDALAALLARISWRYARLLVVFECYPPSWDYSTPAAARARASAGKPVDFASAWSPPVVRAVKKLRRDLAIAEGVQTKRAQTTVAYAFARTVGEAAAYARAYGDMAQARDTTEGALWGDRRWLTHEERDGEYDLCGVDGMNLFAASLLLSQTTLEDLLEKHPDDRLLEFGELVGVDRIMRFNVEVARRLELMQLPPSSPIFIDTSSSLNSVPYIGDSEMEAW